ncbi:MAG: PilZ domain-containing protein [Deltaproteobacteria bacterium]|nr:PilZ domain-containing protein [Deltaproteobacteria bacterium]
MQPNRRQYTRYQVAVAAEIEIEGETKIGETRDVSLGGASVSIDCQLEEERVVELALILTEDGIEDPDEEPFETRAKVIWSAPCDDGRFVIGIRFVQLGDEKTAQLKRFIEAMRNNN